MSCTETVSGSCNRARNAFDQKSKFAVGMEGGLEMIDGLYHLVCVVTFFDGKEYFTGISQARLLPQEVSDGIMEGGDFGALIRQYQQHNPLSDVKELITREKSFIEATKKGWQEYNRISH